MAAAVTVVKTSVFGDRKAVQANIAFSGTYTTTGEAVAPSAFGLSVIDRVLFEGATLDSSSTALLPAWNATTGKIMLFEGVAAAAPFAEKNNTEAYVAGTTARVLVIGY